MKRSPALFLLLSTCFIFSCNNSRDPENTNEVEADEIYLDYQVRGEEGSDVVTVFLQFKYNDETGGTLLLEEPSKVELDGELIQPDSSRITGPFYEIQKPGEWLAAQHKIVFTDNDKRKYSDTFNFQPLQLVTTVADTIHRSDLHYEFIGLGEEGIIRVLLTDTSFQGNGINRLDTVRNNHLVITKDDLESLYNGPIQLEVVREYERPLLKGELTRGRLVFSYSIKREFFLAD